MPIPAPGPDPAPPATAPSAVARPVMLWVVCLVVVLQAAVLVGLAGAWVRDLVGGASEVPGATVFLVVFSLGIAAVLIGAARALARGRRWARSPVITWQILLIAMAVGWLGAEPTGWAVAVLASALLVVVGLLLPSVVAATTGRGRLRDDGGSRPG